MSYKTLEERRQYYRKYRQNNKERVKGYHKKFCQKNKNKLNQLTKKWQQENPEKVKKYHKEYQQKIKLEIFTHYSGEPPKCMCCGEKYTEFLSIDHINGGGAKHKRKIGTVGFGFYLWLKRNSYPKGYRILCMNCNHSYGMFSYCPHKRKK